MSSAICCDYQKWNSSNTTINTSTDVTTDSIVNSLPKDQCASPSLKRLSVGTYISEGTESQSTADNLKPTPSFNSNQSFSTPVDVVELSKALSVASMKGNVIISSKSCHSVSQVDEKLLKSGDLDTHFSNATVAQETPDDLKSALKRLSVGTCISEGTELTPSLPSSQNLSTPIVSVRLNKSAVKGNVIISSKSCHSVGSQVDEKLLKSGDLSDLSNATTVPQGTSSIDMDRGSDNLLSGKHHRSLVESPSTDISHLLTPVVSIALNNSMSAVSMEGNRAMSSPHMSMRYKMSTETDSNSVSNLYLSTPVASFIMKKEEGSRGGSTATSFRYLSTPLTSMVLNSSVSVASMEVNRNLSSAGASVRSHLSNNDTHEDCNVDQRSKSPKLSVDTQYSTVDPQWNDTITTTPSSNRITECPNRYLTNPVASIILDSAISVASIEGNRHLSSPKMSMTTYFSAATEIPTEHPQLPDQCSNSHVDLQPIEFHQSVDSVSIASNGTMELPCLPIPDLFEGSTTGQDSYSDSSLTDEVASSINGNQSVVNGAPVSWLRDNLGVAMPPLIPTPPLSSKPKLPRVPERTY